MRYDHTQYAPLYLTALAPAVVTIVAAALAPVWFVRAFLIGMSVLLLILAASFRYLRVSDEDDHLLVQFGPLPLFRRRILYSEIERVGRSKSTFLDSWGIHRSPQGGWIYNLWGFDCVDVYLSGNRKLRIGTDDPSGLEAFLEQRTRPAR